MNFGTNFEKARGFVRSNWKTKNYNPENNPLLESSSEEEYDDEYDEEEGEDNEAAIIDKKSHGDTVHERDDEDDDDENKDYGAYGEDRNESSAEKSRAKDKENRPIKSAHTRARSKNLLSNAAVHDLT